jgi:hypothetical protein
VTVAPDFAAPIVGWRTWLVVKGADGLRLGSVVQPTLWEPLRELVGECLAHHRLVWFFRRRRRSDHDAPHLRCSCGIYASKDAQLAGQYVFTREFERRHVVGRVIGRVSLWGRVLACPRGWRAQFAYPERIYVPMEAGEVSVSKPVEEVALALGAYGVPVEIVSHRGEPDLLHSLALHSPA